MQERSPSAVAGGFIPARLTIARNARGLKQIEVADAIERTPPTVSKWENEAYGQAPDVAAIAALSDLLRVRENWFYKPIAEDEGVAFFRSLRSELALARDKAAAKLRFVDDIYVALSERVEFPSVDVPDLMNGLDYKTLTLDDINRIADQAREYWGLGDDPIEDVMVVIENAGVAVAEDFVESTKLDGVSRWFQDRPVMLLARDKSGAVRRRFDAAHELGHLILHQSVPLAEFKRDLTLIEEQAMAFAGAFLLPTSSFASDIEDVTLDGLADIKPKWKVSIGAMIKRVSALSLITPDHTRNLWKYYSYRRWWGNEPYDETMPIERPINLKAAMEMIAADGASEVLPFLDDTGLLADDVAQLTGIEPTLLEVQRPPRPRLRVVRRGGIDENLEAAND